MLFVLYNSIQFYAFHYILYTTIFTRIQKKYCIIPDLLKFLSGIFRRNRIQDPRSWRKPTVYFPQCSLLTSYVDVEFAHHNRRQSAHIELYTIENFYSVSILLKINEYMGPKRKVTGDDRNQPIKSTYFIRVPFFQRNPTDIWLILILHNNKFF